MKDSSIQWTDHTFNPWEGCTKVAPECKNCYAEVLVDKRFGRAKWGPGQPRRRTSEALWRQPLKWNEMAMCDCGKSRPHNGLPAHTLRCSCNRMMRRPRVFCLSLGDWLDEEVPIEWLADLLKRIHECPNLDFQLLTKRPQNFGLRIKGASDVFCGENASAEDAILAGKLFGWLCDRYEPDNIWIGVSAGADQRAAIDIPAKIHFLSCEPMLKPLDSHNLATQEFDWMIFGGESGTHARTFDIIGLDEALRFCDRNKIAPFVKQMGAKPVFSHDSFKDGQLVTYGWAEHVTFPRGCEIKLGDGHGGVIEEWPARFRVREFPKAA